MAPTVSETLTMKLHPLVARNREAILRTAAHHGARNGRVFGSFARGDARACALRTELRERVLAEAVPL